MPDREEQYKDLYDTLIAERLELVLREMAKDDAEIQNALEICAQLSQNLMDNHNIPMEAKLQIDEYLSANQLVSSRQHEHIYKRGAMDMVVLLRRVGVIK